MKTQLKALTAVALFFGLSSAPFATADTEVGRVALVSGDVRVAKSEADKGRPAKSNDTLFNSDVVKTGDGASAKLLFTDQSLMDVGPASALKISNYALKDVENRTGTFSILYGKLRALVTKKVGDSGKLEVKSGDAIMGVRGTEFMVDAPRGGGGGGFGGTQVVVVSGLVSVRPPNGGPPINVGAGQMVVASPKNFAAAAAAQASGGGQGKSESKGDSKGGGDSKTGGDAKGGGDSGGGVVTKVSAEQMKSMASDMKAPDMLMQALDLNAPKSGGGANGPSNGPGSNAVAIDL
ncbi:MAG: FecR domain-containing protein, partial [Deltaproteobacteria bacterium]|nr:FecR domain-containing protein [Deltaproteobacteria bacterium]